MKRLILSIIFGVYSAISIGLLQADENPVSLDQAWVIQNPSTVSAMFPKTTDGLEHTYHATKDTVINRIQQIISIAPEARTFENTVLAYDKTLCYFRSYGSVLATLKMCHPDQMMRERAEKFFSALWECMIDLETNQGMYRAFKEYQALPEPHDKLNQERQYYLTEAMCTFRRAGLDLDPKAFDCMKQLQKQIASLVMQFHTNVAQDASTVRVKREGLEGLDSDYIDSLTREGSDYILPCDYPTRTRVMDNCSIETTRQDYSRAFYNRAFPGNVELLKQLIDKRNELAKLLGYDSYAAFDISSCMAKTPQRVETFLNDLAVEANLKAKQTWEVIVKNLPESVVLTPEGKIKAWDVNYVLNYYMKKHGKVDHAKIAEYFPMEKTIQSLLKVYESFFSLKFRLVDHDGIFWDPSVQMIEVLQADDESLIGYVLLDLFPRKGKYTHCCCNGIIPPISFDRGAAFQPALAVVIANFSKPTESKPTLLSSLEVNTFFHEFGHAIHALLGRAEMPTKGAYNTKMDFIEVPSQLLEQWMWDPEILKLISHHYKTGESLPDDVIEALIKSKDLGDSGHPTRTGDGDHIATQLLFSQLSLNLYKGGQPSDQLQIEREVYKAGPQIVALDPQAHFLCSFIHLADYGSKYYSYLWSRQRAMQIFEYIKAHGGLLNGDVGKRYISKVIGRGGSDDPDFYMADFLNEQ